MKLLRSVSTTAALSVAGAGIAIGGVGLATADDTSGEAGTSASAPAMPGFDRGPGPGGHHGPGGPVPGVLAPELAEALDLDESEVSAALRAVFEELRPEALAEGEERARPSEEEREERQAAFVTALAEELGVSEADLSAALESLRDQARATVRSALEERLDEAVGEGTLTEADRTSVLKAFDAGVLQGPHGHHGPGPDDSDEEVPSS